MNKKGIELSMNFLVMLILAIVVFGFGVSFVYNLSQGAIELRDMSEGELDEKIGELLCSGADRVCIGSDRKTISRGDIDTFGVKVVNIKDDTQFQFLINQDPDIGFTKQGSPITTGLEWKPKTRTLVIERNSDITVGIGVSVPKGATPGTYIFNVEVKYDDPDVPGTSFIPYDDNNPLQKIYVDVP